MKVEYPDDLTGRMMACKHRAVMMHVALENIAYSALVSNGDKVTVPTAALKGFADSADELADEIHAIHEEICRQSHVSRGGSR